MKMVIDAYCELCMLEEDVMYMDMVSNLNIAKYRLVAEHGCESGDLKYADYESRSQYYSMDKLWDTSIRGYNINKVMGSDGVARFQ